MIAFLRRLFKRRAKPDAFARVAWSPSLYQIKIWNRERLDISPALNQRRR